MRPPDRPRTDLWALLAHVDAASPVEAIDVMADGLGVLLGARSVCFYITDVSGRAVARFGGTGANAARERQQGAEHAPVVGLAGTVYEHVMRTQRPHLRTLDDGSELTVPVTDRGDTVGVMELDLPWHPDEHAVADIAGVARAFAYVVVASSRHTDLFEWAQRSTRFSLAAEIQRRLLPASFTCETAQFTVAGWLEPANAVGGDTFDYALDRDVLHLSITDAVGHDVNAAMLATVLVGSLRNGRRCDLDLETQTAAANDALAAHSPIGEFVTGQVVRVDLRAAVASVVNAGHPFPLRLRDGRIEEVELLIDRPFGLQPGRAFRVQRLPLQPGDRIVLLTDGMLERNAARMNIRSVLAASAGVHPREVVRELGDVVMRATGGDLRDDATVMCLDWRGGPPRDPNRTDHPGPASP